MIGRNDIFEAMRLRCKERVGENFKNQRGYLKSPYRIYGYSLDELKRIINFAKSRGYRK